MQGPSGKRPGASAGDGLAEQLHVVEVAGEGPLVERHLRSPDSGGQSTGKRSADGLAAIEGHPPTVTAPAFAGIPIVGATKHNQRRPVLLRHLSPPPAEPTPPLDHERLQRLRLRACERGVNPVLYRLARLVLVPFFRIYFRLEYAGSEHIPTLGPGDPGCQPPQLPRPVRDRRDGAPPGLLRGQARALRSSPLQAGCSTALARSRSIAVPATSRRWTRPARSSSAATAW